MPIVKGVGNSFFCSPLIKLNHAYLNPAVAAHLVKACTFILETVMDGRVVEGTHRMDGRVVDGMHRTRFFFWIFYLKLPFKLSSRGVARIISSSRSSW